MAESKQVQQQAGAEDLRRITIVLDTYDDIFSDFDTRPYSQRELSEDFMKEINRRYLENRKGKFELHFTVPKAARDEKVEAGIKKRLRAHFVFMTKLEGETIRNTRNRGYLYIAVGAAVLLANVFSLFALDESSVAYQVLSVIMIPAGWYGMFTGIGKVIDEPAESVEKKKVFEKFEKADYIFMASEGE